MAGVTSFKISLFVKNDASLPEIAERAKDLSVVFDHIIGEWVAGNERKFGRGMGASNTGATQDTFGGAETTWQALSAKYGRQKEREGFPDWLMVRTGDLMNAMTTRGAMAEFIENTRAVFGMPLDEEQAIKVEGNWKRRQAIFLDRNDRLMIERNVKNFMELGGDYQNILFTRGLQNVAAKNEQKRMDAEFRFRMSGE